MSQSTMLCTYFCLQLKKKSILNLIIVVFFLIRRITRSSTYALAVKNFEIIVNIFAFYCNVGDKTKISRDRYKL